MGNVRCESCGIEAPQSEITRINEKRLCGPCGEREATAINQNNVCAQCGTDCGSTILPRVGGAPFCEECSKPLYNVQFPGWLRSAFIGLSLALVFAIYHALPYFKAGRDYYRAEKLYKQGRYPDAIKGFESALKSGQDAKEIRLRLALAYLKDGQPTQAWPVVKDRSFDESAEFREMQGYFDRFDKAYAKIEEAHKLTDDNHSADAAKLLHEAKTIYPELQGLDEGLEDLAVSDAYERKDYDEFVRLSELRYKHYPSSGNAAGLASALACRYAIGGDPTVRAQVEDMLRTAQSMIKTDEEKKSFEEYEPRIRYRLDKREIIDKKQYDRRFRSEQPKEKS